MLLASDRIELGRFDLLSEDFTREISFHRMLTS